ncbi:MAG: LptA/OstA family protein [Deltaproteobacteria bacterium]
MGTPEFGHQTERRRKRVMWLAAAGFAGVLLAIAGYRWKSHRSETAVVVPKPLPSNVSQQLSGYSFTRSDKSGQVFTVHAARTIAFQGDETVLNGVSVEVFGKTGNRHDLIRTRSCDYNRKTGELFAEGKVEIELNAPPNAKPDDFPNEMEAPVPAMTNGGTRQDKGRVPVFLETSRLNFAKEGSLVVSDAPVRFRAGNASGTAQGLAYATRDEWVEFKKDVVLQMDPHHGETPSAPLRLEASRLRFEKATGVVTLWGPISITRLEQRVSAATGQVRLDDRNRVVAAQLDGGVKARVPLPHTMVEGSAGRLTAEFDPKTSELRFIRGEDGVEAESTGREKVSRLSARSLQLDFSGVPARPKGGLAAGNVHITSEAISSAIPIASTSNPIAGLSEAKQTLEAAAVRFTLAAKGKFLREAETAGMGRMTLYPKNPKTGQRVITAEPFVLDFDQSGHPATMRGLANVKMIFKPAPSAKPGTPDAVTTSNALLAKFDSAGRSLRSIDQTGDFRFEQGTQRAFADSAHYDLTTEIATLVGRPRMEDQTTQARADRILINTATDDVEGFGHVQTSHLEESGKNSKPGANEPVNVVANRMLAKRQSQFVHYEGNVRVWHGGDVVQSESVDVYKAERRVRTNSPVLTSFLQPVREGKGSESGKAAISQAAPVTIRADGLEYSDEGRKATYFGNVQLETHDATLRSNRMDIFFSPRNDSGGSEIERALAQGNVTVVQPGRRATGERAEYFAGPDKIILSGGPPAIYDEQRGFTTGRQLTFFLRDDTIFLDGGDQSPTLSKHRIPQ